MGQVCIVTCSGRLVHALRHMRVDAGAVEAGCAASSFGVHADCAERLQRIEQTFGDDKTGLWGTCRQTQPEQAGHSCCAGLLVFTRHRSSPNPSAACMHGSCAWPARLTGAFLSSETAFMTSHLSMSACRSIVSAEEVHVGVGAHDVPLYLLPQLRVLHCTVMPGFRVSSGTQGDGPGLPPVSLARQPGLTLRNAPSWWV